MHSSKTSPSNLSDSNIKVLTPAELGHSMAHYLLVIHFLKEERGFARVTDVAKKLNLTKGSVSIALNSLKKKEFVVEEEDCKFLKLSEMGHKMVHRILSSRTLLFHFFKDLIGVTEETALKDACLMEHLLSDETRKKLFSFLKEIACECSPKKRTKLLEKFQIDLDLCDISSFEEFEQNHSANFYE